MPAKRMQLTSFLVWVSVSLALGLSLGPTRETYAQDHPAAGTRTTLRKPPLTSGQARAIGLLQRSRPAKPEALFLFADPNRDPDDLTVMIAASYLQRQGFLDLRCLVTTLGNRDVRTLRAKFARSVLEDLGMAGSRVGVGLDYAFEVRDARGAVDPAVTRGRERDHSVFVETPLVRPSAPVEADGALAIRRELEQVPDHTAVFVINAGMADVAAVLRDSPDLVKRKMSRVVMMGGVEPEVDARRWVVADKRAYNNTTDQPSADYSYARVQELGLPLVVMSKEAAYAAAVPRSFYDELAATGHPVGIYLRDQQQQSLRHLWEGIAQGRAAPALTVDWFFRTFTDVDVGSDEGRTTVARLKQQATDFDAIWEKVSRFNLYDPLSLLAATPGASPLLFRSETLPGAAAKVEFLGKNSVIDATLVRDLLVGIGIESLNAAVPRKSRTERAPGYPERQHVAEDQAAWYRPLPEYDPPEYTAEVVFENVGRWADPRQIGDVRRKFLTRTAAGDDPIALDSQGRPLNPLGRTGLGGRGLLGRWGRNEAADALLTRLQPETGRLQVLIIERRDNGQQALPGGMVDAGENAVTAATRELLEETGIRIDFEGATMLYTGVVDDPRNTDHAWIETTVWHRHLPPDVQQTLKPEAGDDARDVKWVDVDADLASSLYASNAEYLWLALLELRTRPELSRQAALALEKMSQKD